MSKANVLGLSVMLLLTACGSDDDGKGSAALSCEPFAACGGALVGKWQLNTSCVNDATKAQIAAAAKVCDQGTASVKDVDVKGSVTFDAQSVAYDGVITVAFSSTFPLSCALGATTCDQAKERLAQQDDVTGAACTTMGTSCSCSYSQAIPIKKQNSYVLSGSTFTETDPSDGSKSTSSYCVNGDTLRVKSEESVDVYTR